MKERGILFSAPMVRALLAGAKTQTRRVVKGATGAYWDHAGWTPVVERGSVVAWGTNDPDPPRVVHNVGCPFPHCPYGVPGDRLWVRETWGHVDDHDSHGPHCCWFAADGCQRCNYGPRCEHGPDRWRPSIHMPRWSSRLTLEITDVRVERLQAITEEDARAEGIAPAASIFTDGPPLSCRDVFAGLWDTINGKRAPWSSNPWVWAITFRRLP